MDLGKNKIRVNSHILSRSFLCAFCSAVALSTIFLIATSSFHYIGITVFAFYFFIFYVIFAIPIQLKLIQKPKKFNIIYLMIYMLGAFVASAIAIRVVGGENPFVIGNFYIIVILAAIVYWMLDSVFLQTNKR
ncbi:hypothetical protein CFK37_17880 [Virgibacillus phasianinus]|uniref:Uncharacterized protein n=1 Tax=Virgibacillus phasianinus TaxID=2017483 RepID=A0A220U6F9_9BACI|nr:UPF0715 family protein [Virgibacillus phasianinus]ASK63894.1 hypothetical protein CFK37_17880 [Virgibacillus phasianinus]